MAKRDPIEDVLFQASLNHWFNDVAAQGIMMTDTSMNIKGWNRWLEIHSGHEARDVIGRSLYDLYPELIERKLDRYFTNALSGQVSLLSQKFHKYLIPLDSESGGNSKNMQQSVRISPLMHNDNIVGTITTITDVTERVDREAQLQRQVKILAALHDISEATLTNPALDDLLRELPVRIGRALEVDIVAIMLLEGNDLVLRSAKGIDADVRVSVNDDLYVCKVAAERRSILIEDKSACDYKFVDPGHIAQSLLGTPLFVKDEVIGVIVVATTRPYRFKEDDVRLLQLVADRLALAIDHTRLYEAERAARAHAETSNRLKDEFLATVSHELRTPLSSILGWITLLKNGKLDAAASATAIDTISRNATSQKELINDLLDVSRVIAGKLNIKHEPVDLELILSSAIETARPGAESKGIELAVDCHPIYDLVLGDESRLHQVFWNLLSNAVKFTPRGGAVCVRLEMVDGQAQISVSDTGQGIKPDFLPFVFDRFRQADGSTARVHGGLGLGLSIVRHLVELHGGAVSVASEGEGKGSTFRVKLPIKVKRADENPVNSEVKVKAESHTDKSLLLSGMKIVVVDDESDCRDWLRVVLTQYGAQVMTAGSASDAIDLLSRTNADALVSDIGMPNEDGYDLIRKVRSLDGANRNIPAVALTAYAGIQERIKVVEAGFQIHLAKPADSAELIAIVSNLRK